MSNDGVSRSSTVRHQLRTPLNQIIGYAEMLLEEAQDRKQPDFIPDLQRIHTAGRRLLAVIDDLFDPAKAVIDRTNKQLLHHELRTPLNQIIGYTEMLQDIASDRGDRSFHADFDKIHVAARELLDLLVQEVIGADDDSKTQPANGAGSLTEAATFLRSCTMSPAAAESHQS